MLNNLKLYQGYIIVLSTSIIAILILQLLIFPKVYHDYSDEYAIFIQYYYNFSIIAIIFNTIALYQYKYNQGSTFLFFLFFLFFIFFVVIFLKDINIILFGISIFFYEVVKNILRIKNKDIVISIVFPVQILLIYTSLNFWAPLVAYIYLNIGLSILLFVYFRMYDIKIVMLSIKNTTVNSVDIVLNLINKDLDKILILNFFIMKDNNTLTLVIVFGLILMPIQLLGKYLVTDINYNNIFNIQKITMFVVALSLGGVFASLFIIHYFYSIDISSYIYSIVLIILSKIIYSIGYLLFSKQIQKVTVQQLMYKMGLLSMLFILAFSFNDSIESLLLIYLMYLMMFYGLDYRSYRRVY